MRFLLKSCLLKALIFLSLSPVYAYAELPIYAAYVSDSLEHECSTNQCTPNALDAEQLTHIVGSLEDAQTIADALAVSDYEVLIGNAIVISANSQHKELVLEITTSWRSVPIDDLILRAIINDDNEEVSASHLLAKWAAHIERQNVLEADKIYSVLGASDYDSELSVPAKIGDFVLMQSALFRDPLQGSITRYTHPQFDDAIVDISVYPFSPFNADLDAQTPDKASNTNLLHLEMENEVKQIEQLIAQANIQDYDISSIQTASINVEGVLLEGLRVEVLLNKTSDPVYSTQYLFQQNDKVIKLTANIPDFMMTKLVEESLPKIKVPNESNFMRSLRES